MLNYGYAILASEIAKNIVTLGLDPYCGLLHADLKRRQSLIFDLIEEFRQQIVDKTVFKLINTNQINETNIDKRNNSLKLESRKLLAGEIMVKIHSDLTFENELIKGYIRVIKVSKEDNQYNGDVKGKRLENAKFEVYDENNNLVDTLVTDENGDGAVDLTDFELILKKNKPKILKGDGDFRSAECIEYLKEADIVVTNPPFSLFREYVAQLMEYDKKFIIIGNQNAITYKEVFPLIKENRLWLGFKCGDMAFTVPESYEARETRFWVDESGQKWRSFGNICWYTNLDHSKRHEDLILYKSYSEEEYPSYDNYNAIEVSKVSEIPCDYYGIMGVPITFLDKYNPEQFEIIGLDRYTVPKEFLVGGRVAINGKPRYARILIRKKEK